MIPEELFRDRIKLKFFYAEKHLNNIVGYQLSGERFNENWNVRLKWEHEAECFLYHLMGVVDALLMRINAKLRLKIKDDEVTLGAINNELSIRHNDLLSNLNKMAGRRGSWYYKLNELRNIATHRNVLNIKVTMGEPIKVSFVNVPNLEIVPYIQDRFDRMKKLVEDIVVKEPLLREPT